MLSTVNSHLPKYVSIFLTSNMAVITFPSWGSAWNDSESRTKCKTSFWFHIWGEIIVPYGGCIVKWTPESLIQVLQKNHSVTWAGKFMSFLQCPCVISRKSQCLHLIHLPPASLDGEPFPCTGLPFHLSPPSQGILKDFRTSPNRT